MGTAMVDASGLVSSVLSPYQSAIGTVLQQVSGDPAMVRQAETSYRSGAASTTQVATDLTGVSSRLSGSWTGQASTAYSGASRNLSGRLDQVQLTLKQQADGLARVAQAQDQARTGVERALGGFTVAGTSLLQMSRQVHPSMVGPLVAQAQRTGAGYYGAAAAQRGSLAAVLSQVAAELKVAASPAVVQRPDGTLPGTAPASDPVYDRIFGCIRDKELSAGGKRRESETPVAARVPASMATPNQTTIPNALDLLRNNPDLRRYAQPPITQNELNAAYERIRRIERLRALAENPQRAAAQAAHAEQVAIHNRDKAHALLDTREKTAANLQGRWQELSQAAAGQPAASPAARAAARAAVAAQTAQRQVEVARASLSKFEQQAATASQAAIRARESAADPEKFVQHNIAGTGLDPDDLRTMRLVGLKRQGHLTRDEQAQMAALEQRPTVRDRVDADTLHTRRRWPNEDLYAWQRKGVNGLDPAGNGSVGERIKQIAESRNGLALTEPFLRGKLAEARRVHGANEAAIVRAVASANNNDPGYAPWIAACYQKKKAAGR